MVYECCGGLPTGFERNLYETSRVCSGSGVWHLASETVDGSALSLQSVDDVESGDGLATSMLGVGDGVTDDGFQEGLEDSAGLLVDQSGDSLDSSSAGETADSGLGDSLDVIPKDFAVPLCSSLAESLTSFSSSGHLELIS